jgi:hypothetical protein
MDDAVSRHRPLRIHRRVIGCHRYVENATNLVGVLSRVLQLSGLTLLRAYVTDLANAWNASAGTSVHGEECTHTPLALRRRPRCVHSAALAGSRLNPPSYSGLICTN